MNIKMENKLIAEFNQTGECILNLDEVVKQWDLSFGIIGYRGDEKNKYTFVVHNDKNNERPETKCQIPEEQAQELIDKLNLIQANDLTLRRAFVLRQREFYFQEIVRLSKLILDKKNDPEYQNGAIQMAKDISKQYTNLI